MEIVEEGKKKFIRIILHRIPSPWPPNSEQTALKIPSGVSAEEREVLIREIDHNEIQLVKGHGYQ